MPHLDNKLWSFTERSLARDIPCMLLCVVHHQGSSPGRKGFKMVVTGNFEMIGSIGGGIMEHKLVELAYKRLQNSEQSTIVKRQIHQDSVPSDKSGMICSGEQTVVLVYLHHEHIELVQKISQAIELNSSQYLSITTNGITLLEEYDLDEVPGNKVSVFNHGEPWRYAEKLGHKDFLHIVGGGHVSLALSKLALQLNFQVTVYDDREGLHTMNLNQYAHSLVHVDYNNLPPIKTINNTYLVVMSFGYRTDYKILETLYPQHFDYFGLLGSKSKIDRLFADLEKSGISREWLDKIEAPVGAAINSQTAVEIAISICSSLIQNRHRLNQ